MLVVIAQKEELKLVEQLGYGAYPVLITGVGAINAITALKDIPKDTFILNIGYAGSNILKPGTIVGVEYVYTNHEKVDFKEESLKLISLRDEKIDTFTHCYTSTDFITKTKIKHPCVFDMELAYICAMFKNVKAIKVVSDNLSIKEYNENKGEQIK